MIIKIFSKARTVNLRKREDRIGYGWEEELVVKTVKFEIGGV